VEEKNLEEKEIERNPSILPSEETNPFQMDEREEIYFMYRRHLALEYEGKIYQMMKALHTNCFCGVFSENNYT